MTTETAALLTPDASRVRAETRKTESRQDVLESFNRVYSAFLAIPRDQLDAIEDKWITAGRDDIVTDFSSGRINFDEGRDSYTHKHLRDKDGKRYQRTFYLQIEGMMGFAEAQAQNPSLTEEEKDQFAEDVSTLERHSFSVIAKEHSPRDLKDPRKNALWKIRKARLVQYELDRIQNNPDLTTGNVVRDTLRSGRRIQTDIRYFVPPKISIEVSTVSEVPAWATSSETGEIKVDTSGNRVHPWETATIGEAVSRRQDEAPWGKPDLPKYVEVRTDSDLAARITRQAEEISSSRKRPTTELATDDISTALRNFENAFTGLQRSQDKPSDTSAKNALRNALVNLEKITGSRQAVQEFLEARKEAFARSTQDDGSSTSKIKILDARAKEKKALDRIYELAEAKSKPPSAFQGETLEPQNEKTRWEENFARANESAKWNSEYADAVAKSEKTGNLTPIEKAEMEINQTIKNFESASVRVPVVRTDEDKAAILESAEKSIQRIIELTGSEEAFKEYAKAMKNWITFETGKNLSRLSPEDEAEDERLYNETLRHASKLRELAISKADIESRNIPGLTQIPEPIPARPEIEEFGPSAGTPPLGPGEPGFDTMSADSAWAEAFRTPPGTPLTPAEVRRYHLILARDDTEATEADRKFSEDYLREGMKSSFLRRIGWRTFEHGLRHRFIERARIARLETGMTYADISFSKNAATAIVTDENEALNTANIDAKLSAVQRGEGSIVRANEALKELVFDEVMLPMLSRSEESITMAEMQTLLSNFSKRHQDNPNVRRVFGKEGSPYGEEAYLFATNLYDLTDKIRRDHTASTFSLEMLDIDLANSSLRGRNEVKLNYADRFVRWAESGRIRGRFLTPPVAGAIFSVATVPVLTAARISTRVPGVGAISGGLSGAFVSAFRRNYDLKYADLPAHLRDIKSGEDLPEVSGEYGNSITGIKKWFSEAGARRRHELERFNQQATISELLDGRDLADTEVKGKKLLAGDPRGLRELLGEDLSIPDNQNALLRRLAEGDTRLNFNLFGLGDMIASDQINGLSESRFKWVMEKSIAMQKLSEYGITRQEAEERIRKFGGEWYSVLAGNQKDLDKAFLVYRVRQSLKAGAGGAVAGVAAGLMITPVLRVLHETGAIDAIVSSARTVINPVAEQVRIAVRDISTEPVSNVLKHFSPPSPPKEETSKIARSIKVGLRPEETNGSSLFQLERPDTFPDSITPANAPSDTFSTESLQSEYTITPDTPPYWAEVDGRPIQIPEGTHWEYDSEKGMYDLVLDNKNLVLINNAYWGPNGNLYFDQNSLWAEQISTEPSSTAEMRKVLGKNGIWKEIATPIDDRQFYSYDKAGSQGNELLLRDGVYENKAGQKFVVLNASEMGTGIQSGNHPNPIDVQKVIDKGQMAFAFEIDGKQIIVPDGADGKIDGKLRLNPLDMNPNHSFATPNGQMQLGDLSRIVINNDVLAGLESGTTNSEFNHFTDLFNLGHNGNNGHISAGRLIHRGGETIFQQFATITGSSEVLNQIQTGVNSGAITKILPGEIPLDPMPTPTPEPTPDPTPTPTPKPTPIPTPEPTPVPTPEPTPEPIITPLPTVEPTLEPTFEPTPEPTLAPTQAPTPIPTPEPTPEASPIPIKPPFTNTAGSLNFQDMIVTPSAPRYGLEKMQSASTRPVSYVPPSPPLSPAPPIPRESDSRRRRAEAERLTTPHVGIRDRLKSAGEFTGQLPGENVNNASYLSTIGYGGGILPTQEQIEDEERKSLVTGAQTNKPSYSSRRFQIRLPKRQPSYLRRKKYKKPERILTEPAGRINAGFNRIADFAKREADYASNLPRRQFPSNSLTNVLKNIPYGMGSAVSRTYIGTPLRGVQRISELGARRTGGKVVKPKTPNPPLITDNDDDDDIIT